MKSLTAVLILFSFAGVAVFWFATMEHNANHRHAGCIAAATQNTDCTSNNVEAFLTFHFNAFNKLSSAILVKNYALTLALLLTSLFLLLTNKKLTTPTLKRVYVTQLKSIPSNTHLKLTAWLSRHENSPTNFY